jgi:glycosyltransferase involved in cell wall biosynthesis
MWEPGTAAEDSSPGTTDSPREGAARNGNPPGRRGRPRNGSANRRVDFARSGEILYISSVDVSLGNGPGVSEREFITALYSAVGSRAHFLIPKPAGTVPDLPVSACTFTLPHRQHHPLHFAAHSFSKVRRARHLLAHRHFDLLVFRLDVLPVAALLITRGQQTPYALKTLGQNSLKILDERGGWVGRSLVGLNRWMVRRVVSNAIVADSVTELQAEFLASGLGVDRAKIVCIDNAVNTRRFHRTDPGVARAELGLADYDPIIGYVGSRPSERGGMALIEAAARLSPRYPRLGVLIVGDGPGMGSLRSRAQELGVEHRCVLTGHVPFDRVPVYVNSLDVAVSISDREDRRAASELKVRQYLACGKPVVISPGGNEFVAREDLGSVVDSTDRDAVAAALDRCLALPSAQREEFALRAEAYMQRHLSMENAIAQRFALWEERLNG